MKKVNVIGVGEVDHTGIMPVTMSNGNTELFKFFCGSVAWPHGFQPGIILLAGRKLGRQSPPEVERTIVYEEIEFGSLPEAGKILKDLDEHYKCGSWCYRKTPENMGFVNYLLFEKNLSDEDLLFHLIMAADDVELGFQLIKEALEKGELVFPKEGHLAAQIQADYESTDLDNMHALRALRYLMISIYENLWYPPPDDDYPRDDLKRCSFTGY